MPSPTVTTGLIPLLASLSSLFGSISVGVLAADCAGDTGANPWTDWAWDIRQAACGDGSCSAQFDDTGKSNCNLQMPIGGGWEISYVASDSDGVYQSWSVHPSLPHLPSFLPSLGMFVLGKLLLLTVEMNSWDATQDIISQCWVQSGAYSESSRTSSGNWSLGNQQYSLTITHSDDLANYQPSEYNLDGQIGNAPPPTDPEPSRPPPPPSAPSSSATPPSTTADPSCPTVPPCPAGKACPDPKPCDQLSCGTDCCGVVPNPQWCNIHCGGMSC